jgi:hypothetical protein
MVTSSKIIEGIAYKLPLKIVIIPNIEIVNAHEDRVMKTLELWDIFASIYYA